jgi:hypothetical protein
MTNFIVIGIVIAGIATLILYGTFVYYESQPTFIVVQAGQPIQIGPVVYTIENIGNYKGDEDITPTDIFFQIRITAENIGTETTRLSGGQFYLLDDNEKKYRAVYGEFSKEDLFNDDLKPNIPLVRTTQFDIPFDENARYRIGILPTKEQSSNDIGIICVQNC